MNASFVARASAYALSAGAHVAFMVVTFGHAAPGSGDAVAKPAPLELVEIPVEVAAPVAKEAPAPLNDVASAGSPAPPTHTHPYPVPFDHDAHPHDPNLVHAPIPGHDDDDHDHEPDHAEPVATAPATRSFTMKITTGGAPAGVATGSSTSVGTGNGGSDGAGAPLAEAAVSVPARLLGTVTPVYPPSARGSEIEADVALEIIVAKDGSVADARVTRPAGYGFDDAAVRAVRAARFSPAVKDGVAVPVRMRWSVAFRLR